MLRPLCEGGRYDLVIDLEPELLRVQCKLARRLPGALLVPVHTNRYTPGGYVSTSYSAGEVDVIAAYSPELHRGFLIPIDEAAGRCGLHLRLEPTRNNQARRDQMGARLRVRTAYRTLAVAAAARATSKPG